jgi:Ca-activated chloride channel family protein
MEVIINALSDLPMHFAFKGPKTDLFAGLKTAAEICHPWNPNSTTLIVISDGDTVPSTGMPRMPASISGVLVIGVGDPVAGKFIDGRHSRQDVSTLRQVAARTGGEFHNGNANQISTSLIRQLTAEKAKSRWSDLTQRDYALMAIVLGTATLAILPLLLHQFGTRWQPGVK